jgi:phosphate/sulfate permease
MPTQPTKEEILLKAQKRVDDKKAFYSHLAVYLLFNIAFIIIWAVTSPGGYIWFIWPICGWGVALALHAMYVFIFQKDSNWEKSSVEREVAKIKKLMQEK